MSVDPTGLWAQSCPARVRGERSPQRSAGWPQQGLRSSFGPVPSARPSLSSCHCQSKPIHGPGTQVWPTGCQALPHDWGWGCSWLPLARPAPWLGQRDRPCPSGPAPVDARGAPEVQKLSLETVSLTILHVHKHRALFSWGNNCV